LYHDDIPTTITTDCKRKGCLFEKKIQMKENYLNAKQCLISKSSFAQKPYLNKIEITNCVFTTVLYYILSYLN